ncbi:LptF/LptG family permease [Rickettsiales endosymbiont of Peranema trichophorum]|uniref:LptF/LptG family permease n=1 Tax=Rickettsiales endosymbiont of Peranema trichophorum TaxID=2486577 RepID=UPI001023E68B|nr:LptF/LptG family permease [Rickettsiales endosymbiont of Peranema trichophorum]RZI45624.1 LptF/LptG family permease [Rickettsiales endosymbiont of Peranema trichophorum]
MIGTLFGYIAKRYMLYLLMVLGGICSIVFMFDCMELLRIAYGNELGWLVLLKLAMMKNYKHIQQVLPFAICIATIMTYSSITKTFELIVARCCGVSVWQFLCPVITIAFIVGMVNIFIFNPIGASILHKYEKLYATHLKRQTSTTVMVSANGLWLRDTVGDNNIIVHATKISEHQNRLLDVIFFITDQEHKFVQRMDAEYAELEEGSKWCLHNVDIVQEQGYVERTDVNCIPTNMSFGQIKESLVHPETIPIYKLQSFIEATKNSGFSTVRHLNYLYKTLLSPFFYISLVLVSLFFSTSMPRFSKTGRNITLGIMFGIVIYFVSDLISALGISGRIPLMLSCSAPTLICMSIGLYLTLHYEDG